MKCWTPSSSKFKSSNLQRTWFTGTKTTLERKIQSSFVGDHLKLYKNGAWCFLDCANYLRDHWTSRLLICAECGSASSNPSVLCPILRSLQLSFSLTSYLTHVFMALLSAWSPICTTFGNSGYLRLFGCLAISMPNLIEFFRAINHQSESEAEKANGQAQRDMTFTYLWARCSSRCEVYTYPHKHGDRWLESSQPNTVVREGCSVFFQRTCTPENLPMMHRRPSLSSPNS